MSEHTRETRTSYDVAVVGSGWAGLTAAIAAAERGCRTVVLEKAPEHAKGGNSQFTRAMKIPTEAIDAGQEFQGRAYSKAEFFRDVMTVTDGRADPDLTQTMVDETPATFHWLTDHLAANGYQWVYESSRAGYTGGLVFFDSIVDKLTNVARANDVQFLFEAEARELVLDPDSNAIAGLEGFQAGDRIRIDADVVVIACGGFEASTERRTKYLGKNYDEITVRGVRYNTGEAIDMALDVGASSSGQWSGAHISLVNAGAPPVGGGQSSMDGYQFGVILDHQGERFVDEGEDERLHTYAKIGQIAYEQGGEEVFVVQDSRTDRYADCPGPVEPVTADSIEELVDRLGIEDRSRAVQTIEEYNTACQDGAELEPFRLDGNSTTGVSPPKSNWAVGLTEPPFVGYPVKPGFTFSFGGLEQSTGAEVLDTSGRPIPGLYAAGNATGGLFYDSYVGGSGVTKAAVFGKLAGENAADYVSA